MEHSFHMLLYRAFHAQRHYLRPSLREAGLEPGQPKLLEYLCRYGACPQRKLADFLKSTPPPYPVCWMVWSGKD